jgi:single-stranded-DNA-specific exonuclease
LLERQWKIAESWPGAAELAVKLGISPRIAQVLYNRGIRDYEQAQRFLEPRLNSLTEPEDMPDLLRAAQRIAEAIRNKESVVVYGDYDVDGITGSAILWHVITQAGGTAKVYVPHRISEGYGLNVQAIKKLAGEGAQLVITVDCGIRDHEALACARQIGLPMIVTDHHEPDLNLPDAYAVLHPARCVEVGKTLDVNPCGALVAFKLAWAVAREISGGKRVDDAFRELLVELTALVALATIADIVPLMSENRVIAKFGLERLSQTKLPGLRALLASAGLSNSKVDSFHVGFVLSPRLNAAGRMGHAKEALELLIVSDPAQAKKLADYLDKQNKARQKLEDRITKEAIELAEYKGQLTDNVPILILAKEGWHAGVIGIVASKLVDRFNKPVVMIALHHDRGQGSARSVAGYDINQGLTACSEHLIGYGGHAMAAGLRLQAEKIVPFMQALQAHAARYLARITPIPALDIDAYGMAEELDANFIWQLKRLGPFGHGNVRPTFATGPAELMGEPKVIGQEGKHLMFSIRWDGRIFRAIAFNQAPMRDPLMDHRRCQLAFEPVLDDYLGPGAVQLRVKAIRVLKDGG